MDQQIVLGITLRADGSSLKGEIAGVSQEIKQQEPLWKSLAISMGLVNGATALLEMGMEKVRQAATFAGDAVKDAARYQTLGVAMEQVGKNAGYTADQMAGFEGSLRKNGIAMIEARSTLTQMASAHIDLSKSAQLARIAQDAAVIGNINSSEAFQRMIYGIQSGQVDVLRTIGINVDFEASYQKLARTLHINANLLTENEKMQARTNAVVEDGQRKSGVYEASLTTAGKQLNSMKRLLDDLSVKMGETFLEAFTAKVFGQSEMLKKANAELDRMKANGDIEAWGHGVAQGLGAVTNGATGTVKALWEHRDAVEAIAAAYFAWKAGAWFGPIVTSAAAATAAEVEFYGAVLTGNAVMLGGRAEAAARATAVAELATADLAAATAEADRARATLASVTALRGRAVAELESTNATLAATAQMGAHSAALRYGQIAADGKSRALTDLAALGQLNARVAGEVAAAETVETAARLRAVAATTAQAEAQAAATLAARGAAAGQGLFSSTLAALGGPVGAITALVIAGGLAWEIWGNKASSAVDQANSKLAEAEARLDKVKDRQKWGSSEAGQAEKERIAAVARLEMMEDTGVKGAAYNTQWRLVQTLTDTVERMKAEQANSPAAASSATQSSGRFAQLASQYAPKAKMGEMLGMLDREYAEEQKLAAGNGAKLADLEASYQRTRKGIIEQMGSDAYQATMKGFTRETTAAKAAEDDRLSGADMSHRLGLLSDQEYIDARLAIELDFLSKSDSILQRKYAAAKNSADREAALAERDALKIQSTKLKRDAGNEKTLQDFDQGRVVSQFALGQDRATDDLRFQSELLGKTALEQQKLTYARQVDRTALDALIDPYTHSLKLSEKRTIEYLQEAEAAKTARNAELDHAEAMKGDWTIGAKGALDDYLTKARDVASQSKDLFTHAFRGMEDALVNFTKTGKLDFKSLADSIITDLIRMQVQESITGPIASAMKNAGGLSGIFSALTGSSSGDAGTSTSYLTAAAPWANGGAFQSAGLHQFANTVVDRPTFFSSNAGALAFHANGNVFGEAGPEAVMPLTRDAAGRLGVRSQGGGQSGGLVVNIVESPGSGGQVQKTQGNNGGPDVLTILVEKVKSAVGQDIAKGGSLAGLMERRYGLSPAMGAVR